MLWSACLLPLLLLLLLPCCYTRLSDANRCLAVAEHCLVVVRGVRVCLLCIQCLLRYLYRAGTYREANLDVRTTPNDIAGKKKHGGTRNGPALVVASLFAAAAAVLLLYYCGRCDGLFKLANYFGAMFGPVFSLKSSSDWALRSLFWMGPGMLCRQGYSTSRESDTKFLPMIELNT